MGFLREARELRPCFLVIARLCERQTFEFERLVGTDHETVRPSTRDGERFGAGEMRRNLFRLRTRKLSLERALVDIRRQGFERYAGAAQKRLARCAFRGEHKRRTGAPETRFFHLNAELAAMRL